jgi:type I restriction enzyme S subunit
MVMTGAVGQQRVPKSFVLESNLPLAPLNEQRRIAAKLDTTLAAVDACRQRLDGVEALLKRFRQAVLAAATSGELTREWREEYELELELWSMRRLPELGEFGRGKSRHRPRNDPRLYGGPYPFIQTGDIAQSNGIITEHEQEYSDFGLAQSRIWPSKTVCITIAANIANTAILSYPACFPDSVVGLVVDQSKALPEFAMWMVDSIRDRLQLLAPATAQKNINLNILGEIQFLLPPVEEQVEIVRRAQALFSLADQLEARLTSARKIVERLTPALLAKAFRGELVPQDPNDEPASALLERIRAARQAEAAASGPSRRGRRQAAANPVPSLFDAALVPPDRLANLLRECGALSERALLAASELDPVSFQAQLALERELGGIQETLEDGEVLLEAVA